jgi:tripartite-type tricarboxylate transporter receptor subunit TctC
MADVPTAIEAGYPEYETYAWYGMYGPKGMPRDVVTRIQQEIARIVRLPEMQQRLGQFGAEAIASTPEEFAAYTKAEHDKFAALIKAAGIKPE